VRLSFQPPRVATTHAPGLQVPWPESYFGGECQGASRPLDQLMPLQLAKHRTRRASFLSTRAASQSSEGRLPAAASPSAPGLNATAHIWFSAISSAAQGFTSFGNLSREPDAPQGAGSIRCQDLIRKGSDARNRRPGFGQYRREEMPPVRHARPHLNLDLATCRPEIFGHAYRVVV